MKKGFVLAAIAALVVTTSTVVFVPSVRAQVGGVLSTWFRFKSPGGEYGIAMGGAMEFTPLQPTYLPAGFQSLGSGLSIVGTVAEESIELKYHDDERFVSITQTKAPADKTLPAGQKVTVDGQPAVLVTSLEGTFEYGFHIRIPEDALVIGTPSAHHPAPLRSSLIAYTDGKRLTWYAGDVKVEMLSNLSAVEMLKIATSMKPAEAGEGEAPFRTRLDLPSDGRSKAYFGEIKGEEGGVSVIKKIEKGPDDSNP